LAAGEFSSGGSNRCSASTLTVAAAGDFCSTSFWVAAGGDRNSASFFIGGDRKSASFFIVGDRNSASFCIGGGGDEDCPVTSLTVGDVSSSLSPSAPSLHVSDHKICCFLFYLLHDFFNFILWKF
jgi:hypothetical protein